MTSMVQLTIGPPATGAPILEQPSEAHPQNPKRQMNHQTSLQAQKQEFRGENNLKLLLQKVFKQSDVGNLGRIVLPKKESETHLPQLDERDGISIAMEDIGNSKIYLLLITFAAFLNRGVSDCGQITKAGCISLKNTGDFVKTNGLQEGDFIVI